MTVKTSKGTEFPLLNLRGKDYLEVKYRVAWFREEHPDWSFESDYLVYSDDMAIARSVVKDDKGRVLAIAHKREDREHFQDFMEKAESSALGRALALLGYGTVTAQELEEGVRIADSPVETKVKPKAGRAPTDEEKSLIQKADKPFDIMAAVEEEKPKPRGAPPAHPKSPSGDYVCQCGQKMVQNAKRTFIFCPSFQNGKEHSRAIPTP